MTRSVPAPSVPTAANASAPAVSSSRTFKGLDACVHCGFCLQSCPTYLTLEDENDSPRGRLVLMRAMIEGELPLTDAALHTHIDRCLGCRACETACPSGVPYGQLLEATRERLTQARPLPWLARLILRVFERPALLALTLWGARIVRATRLPRLLSRLPGRPGFAMAMLAATERPLRARAYRAAGDGSRGTVAVLRGCVMQGLYGATNDATARVLAHNDYVPGEAPGQRCCGALHAHAGDLEGSRRLARANIDAFERSGAAHIAVNAAGCGAHMKDYGHLLADDPEFAARAREAATRVRDVSELLAAAGPKRGRPVEVTVAYDAPCHLLHAQRVNAPPLAVLAAVPGVELRPLEGAEHCCGSAGIYNLIEPETSNAVLAPKLRSIGETGAELVATGNPGCLMQIGAGLRREGIPVRTVHPVDLLDASYGSDD